ncbi:hypothetical protein niasHT_001301 [Heterodera trifolii]|uniref:Uncharacterized protein n=1 Tax=Heterodera trifolii TaxID=157864 RepID=A0ABD2M7X4_9BILA
MFTLTFHHSNLGEEDREAATKILDHLEVEAQPTAVFRLGRYDPQRTTPRPLKVVMPTTTHQHMSLGGWKRERVRLLSQKNLARLFVRPALTKEQLKEEYEARVRANKTQLQWHHQCNPHRQKTRLLSTKMGQNRKRPVMDVGQKRRRPVKTLQNLRRPAKKHNSSRDATFAPRHLRRTAKMDICAAQQSRHLRRVICAA